MQDLNIIHQKIIAVYESFDLRKIDKRVHTTFWFEDQAISYIKQDAKQITIGLHKGYLLNETYPFAHRCNKYIRHLHFDTFTKEQEEMLRKVIHSSIGCAIELQEQKKLKKQVWGVKSWWRDV